LQTDSQSINYIHDVINDIFVQIKFENRISFLYLEYFLFFFLKDILQLEPHTSINYTKLLTSSLLALFGNPKNFLT